MAAFWLGFLRQGVGALEQIPTIYQNLETRVTINETTKHRLLRD